MKEINDFVSCLEESNLMKMMLEEKNIIYFSESSEHIGDKKYQILKGDNFKILIGDQIKIIANLSKRDNIDVNKFSIEIADLSQEEYNGEFTTYINQSVSLKFLKVIFTCNRYFNKLNFIEIVELLKFR